MNKALALALFAAAVLAAGCASSEKKRAAKNQNPAPCPNISVLADAARIIDFDGETTIENVAYSAEILGVELTCRYSSDGPIKAGIKIDMAFGRGPKGLQRERVYGYWVAVTLRDVDVIEKAVFTVPVEFGADTNIRTAQQKIDEILIPRANQNVSGQNFEVVVGLVLTPQQAIFNRSGKSLKFPEVK